MGARTLEDLLLPELPRITDPTWRARCEYCGKFVKEDGADVATWKEGGAPEEPDYAEYRVWAHRSCVEARRKRRG